MIVALGDLFVAFLVVLAAVCIVVVALAVRDCLRKGQTEWAEFNEWQRARDVTGRVSR